VFAHTSQGQRSPALFVETIASKLEGNRGNADALVRVTPLCLHHAHVRRWQKRRKSAPFPFDDRGFTASPQYCSLDLKPDG